MGKEFNRTLNEVAKLSGIKVMVVSESNDDESQMENARSRGYSVGHDIAESIWGDMSRKDRKIHNKSP